MQDTCCLQGEGGTEGEREGNQMRGGGMGKRGRGGMKELMKSLERRMGGGSGETSERIRGEEGEIA